MIDKLKRSTGSLFGAFLVLAAVTPPGAAATAAEADLDATRQEVKELNMTALYLLKISVEIDR